MATNLEILLREISIETTFRDQLNRVLSYGNYFLSNACHFKEGKNFLTLNNILNTDNLDNLRCQKVS